MSLYFWHDPADIDWLTTDLQPLGDGALPEAAEPGEGGVVLVEAHGDVEAVALLLLLQADGERAPHRVAQPLTLNEWDNWDLPICPASSI